MKKIFTSFFLVYCLHNFAQVGVSKNLNKTNNVTTSDFGVSVVFRLYPTFSTHFGENAFAKAHSSNGGFGTSLSVLKLNDFRAGLSYEFTSYSVSDISKVGNFKNSNNQSFTWFISYDYRLNKTVLFVPNIGYGSNFVNQKSNSKRFGNYYGNHFRLGVQTDFEFENTVAAFVGIHYINATYGIETNPAFKDYFEKSHQIQFSIGLKIF